MTLFLLKKSCFTNFHVMKEAVYKLPSVVVLSSESVVAISSVTIVVVVVSTTHVRGGTRMRRGRKL